MEDQKLQYDDSSWVLMGNTILGELGDYSYSLDSLNADWTIIGIH